MMDATSHRRVRLFALIAAGAIQASACGTQPAATNKSSSAPPHVQAGITLARATKVVRSYMTREFKANLTWDVAVQSELEAPPQLYIDDLSWLLAKAAGQTPAPTPKNLASLPLRLFVPPGANFFAAYINRTYMVFVQQGKQYVQTYSPNTYQGSPVAQVQLNKQGYATFIAPSGYGKLKLTPMQVAARYAADLQTGSEGKPVTDTTFAPGPDTSQAFVKFVVQSPNETTATSVKALADPVYAFALKGRGALVFCCVEADRTYTAAKGQHFAVVKGASDGLAGVMPAGNYTQVTYQGEITLAAIVPPAGSSAKVQVVGADYGPIKITGK